MAIPIMRFLFCSETIFEGFHDIFFFVTPKFVLQLTFSCKVS